MHPLTHSSTRSTQAFIFWLSHFFFFAILSSGYAAHNITIDDTNGDAINFSSPPSWPWENSVCSQCGVPPDPKFSFNETYKNVLLPGEARNVSAQVQIRFVGTSVHVFMAVSDRKGTPGTNCNFTIDGQLAGSFSWTAGEGGSNKEYIYNMLAFSKDELSDTEHLMSVASIQTTPNGDNLLNIDRVVYTSSANAFSPSEGASPSSSSITSVAPTPGSGTNSTSSKKPKILIVGAVVGSVGFIALALIIAALWLRRHRKTIGKSPTQDSEGVITVFPLESEKVTDVGSSPDSLPSTYSARALQGTDDNIEPAPPIPRVNTSVDERLAQIEAEIRAIRNQGALPPPYQRT
ncbi:hypothetical protein DL96DRAFT_1685141 [Flagelloscypha sp. PMI_526]|nr:hypothetical protein DL96DRAFT_1685141 [Flagelloscypha sp. PMI_526]